MGIYQDNKDAMEFFRNSKQLESNGKWQEFVEQSELEAAVHEPRNMELAKASPWDYTSNVNNPGLEQTEVLRPGETLEDWEPNPFLKPHAEGGRIGLKPGGIVEPGVTHYATKGSEEWKKNISEGRLKKISDLTLEQKANLKTWMDNTGSTLEDYNKKSSSYKGYIRSGRVTGIKQTGEFGKKLEGPKTKEFRSWLSKQDPETLTADSVDDLIKQSKIKTTSKTQRSGLVNAISRIMEEKEFAKFKNITLGREYSRENINQLSDDLLKAYAEDDITHLMDPKHKTSLSDIRINRRSALDRAIKNTGLDEETIFNLLDDRDAFQELELSEDLWKRGRVVDPDKAKFYKQAENWIVKNSKRYADPDKFKKAFIRTFGKNNDIIQKINKPNKRMQTSAPFSNWFRSNILGTSEQALKGQAKPGYSPLQLDNIFKTAIYTNNENVRNKIINELTDILPEKGSKRIPDIRDKFINSPILKKFGLNRKIDGPIARLIAKEVGDDLLKQVSLFRKPWLGTTELLTYLKDRVNPKYKSMFEEAGKAVLYAQRNQWPEAKKALNISESVMFDHKIPKALIELGYADDIEYIKVNPTSGEFNARIKNNQFDKPMIKLANQWEKAKTVDAKSKVVGEMNTLKDTFSKKYGNYLDDVKINVDKTGKPIFSSKVPVVTKKTDLVKSLTTSLQHEKFPTMNKTQQKKLLDQISKTFKERGIKVTSKEAGFIAKDLLEDIVKLGLKTRRGAQGVLAMVGLDNPIGWAIEGIIEGGIYDYYRRKGYDHNQAFAETFTPRLAYEGFQGKSTKDVPWYGGSEKLREKELIGDPQQNPKVLQYIKALEDKGRVDDAFAKKEGARDDFDLAEASADVRDLAKTGTMGSANKILNPESMASQAYNTAVEKRDALDQRRRREYLEKVEPAFLEREQKSFDIYVRDKEGKILYEKMTSPYKKRYEEMKEYKGDREGIFGRMSRKEYEKYQEIYPNLKNIPYEDVPKFGDYTDFLKLKPEGFNKTYKELFPTPASRYDWDLTGEVARAGGVANMADGGLTRTVARDSEGIMSLKK